MAGRTLSFQRVLVYIQPHPCCNNVLRTRRNRKSPPTHSAVGFNYSSRSPFPGVRYHMYPAKLKPMTTTVTTIA